MIYDFYSGDARFDSSKIQSEDSRDEFTLGFEQGHYAENPSGEIETFSVPQGSFPNYREAGEGEHSLEKNTDYLESLAVEKNSIDVNTSEDSSRCYRKFDSEERNLVGSSFDTRNVRNKWIDAVENLLDLAGYGEGQLNSRKKFAEKTLPNHSTEKLKKWMLLPGQ